MVCRGKEMKECGQLDPTKHGLMAPQRRREKIAILIHVRFALESLKPDSGCVAAAAPHRKNQPDATSFLQVSPSASVVRRCALGNSCSRLESSRHSSARFRDFACDVVKR